MAKQRHARLSDVLGLLHRLCPPCLAEDWDNVGLQVGDPGQLVDKILVCLDAEDLAVQTAISQGAQLIIAHHPLIFRPLKRLSPTDSTGQVLFSAIQNNIAIASAHTNLDRAADGLNDWLAATLELSDLTPLEKPATDTFAKIVVYVPEGHETAIMEALFAAGAGSIGDYDRCSFRVAGTGSFRGADTTDPFIGTPGVFEETREYRVESIIPRALLAKAIERLVKAHPYEDVAYDIIPLANVQNRVGLGRIGHLAAPVALKDFASRVKDMLGSNSLRMVGCPDQKISKVAVCGGSGMCIYNDAVRQGADCLVTGDIKFHEAQRARNDGVALVDAGHFPTEHIMINQLSKRLRRLFEQRELTIEVIEMTAEQDPFQPVF